MNTVLFERQLTMRYHHNPCVNPKINSQSMWESRVSSKKTETKTIQTILTGLLSHWRLRTSLLLTGILDRRMLATSASLTLKSESSQPPCHFPADFPSTHFLPSSSHYFLSPTTPMSHQVLSLLSFYQPHTFLDIFSYLFLKPQVSCHRFSPSILINIVYTEIHNHGEREHAVRTLSPIPLSFY